MVERALTYLSEGKRAMARKDFEKVLAENSNYPGLREHLASFDACPRSNPAACQAANVSHAAPVGTVRRTSPTER